MASKPRSARTKRLNRSDQAEIVLPDLSVPPRVRRSPSTSMATASALASGSTSSATSIPAPSTVPNPSTSSTIAADASTSVATSSVPVAAPPPPESSSNPSVSIPQPSNPLPARPQLGEFYSPHHINRQHYERYTKLDKRLISIGAVVENDSVAIDSLIEHFRYQEWDKYIQMKGIGYPYVLKCFFANISSENYSFPLKSFFTKEITISIDTLSSTFNLPISGVDVFEKTLKDFDGYIDGDTAESAMNMIFKEGETDLDNPTPQQMKLLPQCLARIVSLNIAPTLSRSTIHKWTPVLVYCLLKKIKVNLPKLIIQTMYFSVQQAKMCLPFGKVLTKIFEKENISLDEYPSMQPRSPFTKRNLGQMHYSSYLVPITLDSRASGKKDLAKASTSGQPEAPAEHIVADQQEVPTQPETAGHQDNSLNRADQQEDAVHQEEPLAGDTSTLSHSIPSLSSPPPPTLSESSTIPIEPIVTQVETSPIPSSIDPPLTQSQSQPAPIDPDQPIIEDDVDDDDGTHHYSPLRDDDLTPSPPHTSQPSSTIPPPIFSSHQPFSIPPSARLACIPPTPTFFFDTDTSMSYDHRWLAHFSKECYYNSVNAMIANSNSRAWETYHMLQTGFQSLNPSIRLPPPTMQPFISVPRPSPAMQTHQLICLQKKSEAIRQKRAAAISSSLRPPTPSSSIFAQSSFSAPATSIPILTTQPIAPTSSFAQTSFSAPPTSTPSMTTKPISSTSSFAPISVSSAFASLSQRLGLRPPSPPVLLSPIDIPIRASPEVTLMSEIFNENSSIDFSKFASYPFSSSSPTPSSAPTQPVASSVPMETPTTEGPASEAPAPASASEATPSPKPSPVHVSSPVLAPQPAEETQPEAASEIQTAAESSSIPASQLPSVEDSPEEPLRWKRRTKVASTHHAQPPKKKKIEVTKPSLAEEVPSPPSPNSTSSSLPPIPIPFSVAHPSVDELCNFVMSQKKKNN